MFNVSSFKSKSTMHAGVQYIVFFRISSFFNLISCSIRYVLTSPNLLRVGSSENVFVEAQDYSGGNLNVRIIVKNHPKKNLEILSKTVTLTADNNFQILTDIQVMPL